MFKLPILMLGVSLVSSLGLAGSLKEANALFAKGEVNKTVNMAVSLNTADGYALAAEVLTLSADNAAAGDRESIYNQAEQYARKAIALDPSNFRGPFELSRALGRLAQYRGILQSLELAGEVKSNLEKALNLSPNYAPAYIGLCLWNSEVPLIAGGRSGEVEPNCNQAIRIEPNVLTHRLEYANALMKVSKRNKRKAIAQLEIAVKLTPRDFWEKQDLEKAKALLNQLR